MAMTLIGFSMAQPAGTVLGSVTPLPDPHVRTTAEELYIPELNQIGALIGIGANVTDFQLDSPSLRAIWLPRFRPLNRDAEPLHPTPWHPLFDNPIPLKVNEALKVRMSNDLATGTARQTCLLWLQDAPPTPVTGAIRPIAVTAAGTLTAFSWTNLSLIFSETLPVGRYQCVGARFESPGLIAFRFFPVGGYWRPGGIGCDASADLGEPGIFRNGRLGVWFEFHSLTPPTVELLSISADVNPVGWLDLIYLGE